MAFFPFTLGLCPSLSPPTWMPLWAHLGGRSEVMLYNCFPQMLASLKNLGCLQESGFLEAAVFCIYH